EPMRQPPELVGAGAIALAADLLSFDDVEEPRLDDHALAVALDGSLDQGLGADRRPIVEVDRVGRDPRALRVLEVGVPIDHLEESRDPEVLGDDVGEGVPIALRTAPRLERRDRDREARRPRTDDRPAHLRADLTR